MKKLIILFFLIGGAVILTAQKTSTAKGFSLQPLFGVDFTYLKIENSDWNQLGLSSQINALETQNNIGFSIGLSYQFQISDQFSIEPQSIVSFQNSHLNYDFENSTPHKEAIQPATLQFPIHLVFSTPTNEKFNPSVSFGGRYTYDISKKEASAKLALKSHAFAVDVGTALSITLKKLTIKPELFYSFGLTNLNPTAAEGLYHTAIKGIYRDTISFRVVVSR